MQIIKTIIFLLAFSCISFAVADPAPVEDLSQSQPSIEQSIAVPVQQSLSLDQRLSKLEQQMSNLTQMDLPGKLDNIQQQVQQLRGELDVQKHDLELLNEQLRNFYQDLDQRIKQAKISSGDGNGGDLTTSATSGKDLFTKEQQAYRAAFSALSDKKYADAKTKMQAYLNDYPNGKYAVNAHYWLGEIYYMQSDLKNSIKEFQAVIDQYPQSAKVPDAMLKLALIHNDRGETEQAKQELQKIREKYPDTSASHLAEQQLRSMK